MVMNVIGSTYTFIVALLTIRKIDEVEKGRTTGWEIVSKIALVCTLISCMYSGIFTHVPELYEFMGSLSATTLLTSIYIKLRKK